VGKATAVDTALARLVIAPSKRGMADLAGELRPDLFTAAAAALLDCERQIAVGTGFPIAGEPETDGPPGAICLLDALLTLGKQASFASWASLNAQVATQRPNYRYIAVPQDGMHPPDTLFDHALVAIEVCARTADGSYRNMRHADISAHAPRFENVFGTRALVAVGDGGNELGMGGLSPTFYDRWNLTAPISTADHLLPGATSNFAAYALVAALAKITGKPLLPPVPAHLAMIGQLVALGFVDGVSGKNVAQVDGLPLAQTGQLLEELHRL